MDTPPPGGAAMACRRWLNHATPRSAATDHWTDPPATRDAALQRVDALANSVNRTKLDDSRRGDNLVVIAQC